MRPPAFLLFEVLSHSCYAPAKYRRLVFFPVLFFVKKPKDEEKARAELAAIGRDLAETSFQVPLSPEGSSN